MTRVRVDDAEWWPVRIYQPADGKPPQAFGLPVGGPVVDIPEDMLARLREAEAAFVAAQNDIAALLGEDLPGFPRTRV